jgi:WD40 repeat protein
MEPAAASMITLVTKEGTETKLDRDTALLLGTVRTVLEDTMDSDHTQVPLIHLALSKNDLDTQLNYLEHWLDVHHSDPETHHVTPRQRAQVVALSRETRERKACIGAVNRYFYVPDLPSITDLALQYRSAHYLSIPENTEKTARMIALTLLSPENLTTLASKPSTPTDNTRPHIPAPLARQIHEHSYSINKLYRSIPTEMIEPISKYISPWIRQFYIEHNCSDGIPQTQFCPHGKHVAFSVEQRALLYDAQSSQLVMRKDHPLAPNIRAGTPNIRSLHFSSTGKFAIMAVWDHGISLFNTQNKSTHTTPIDFPVFDAHISPDETTFIVRGDSNQVPIIDINTNRTIKHEKYGIAAAFFAPLSGVIITQSHDGFTKITDPKTYQLLHEFNATVDHNQPITPKAFSTDGTQLVYGSGKQTIVIDAKTFALKYSIDHETEIKKAEFSPDGSRIIMLGQPGTITIFDTQTRTILKTFKYDGRVEIAGCSPDSRTILLRFPNRNDKIKMIDIQKGQELVSMHHSWLDDFTFSSDSKLIACTNGFTRNCAKILDGNSGHLIHSIENSELARSLSFSPDSTKLAIATHKLFILEQKLPAKTLEQHLLIRVLAQAREKGTIKDAWESPWVQRVLATYTNGDGTPDRKSIDKIKEAFKNSASLASHNNNNNE